MSVNITTIIENNKDDEGVLSYEHGLSLYIQAYDLNILFDTGKTGDFIDNAKKLNIDLNNIDYTIISHGHYDHSGGYRKLVSKTKNLSKFIVGKGFFNKKHKKLDNNYIFNGNSFDKKYIDDNDIDIKYVDEDIYYINENIMLFKKFKRVNDFETISDKFKIKKDNTYIKDEFSEEIVLGIRTEKGFLVILGCSHIGIVNILENIIERTGENIYCIIGGTHLIEADDYRIDKTIEYIKKKDIKIVAVSHCTGEYASKKLKQEFEDRFIYNNTGNRIDI